MKPKVIYILFLFFLFSVKGSNGAVVFEHKMTFERPWLDYKWVVEKIDGQKIEIPSEEKLAIRIDPIANSFSGFLGCNRMGGNITVVENQIKFKNVVATSNACDYQQMELLILNTLMQVTNFGIIEDRLYLSNSSGIKMVLIRS